LSFAEIGRPTHSDFEVMCRHFAKTTNRRFESDAQLSFSVAAMRYAPASYDNDIGDVLMDLNKPPSFLVSY
jgi:hypothetical protein